MLRNTERSFGLIAIALHWVMAIGIFFMFGLGLYMVELTYYDAWYKGSLDLHKSIGVILFIVLFCRWGWRRFSVSPISEIKSGRFAKFEQLAAHLTHVVLYGVMFALMISGYLISTADGRSVSVFGLIDLPSTGALIENQEDVAGLIHEVLAWLLIGIVVIHALAAFKHHLIDRDNTLKRMLYPFRNRME